MPQVYPKFWPLKMMDTIGGNIEHLRVEVLIIQIFLEAMDDFLFVPRHSEKESHEWTHQSALFSLELYKKYQQPRE